MPNILVKIPKGSFPGEAGATLLREITAAAATSEQIPEDLKKRSTTWVVIHEVEPQYFACGGIDASGYLLPCIAIVYVPEGVLGDVERSMYVKLVDAAFKKSLPEGETRQLATSVVLSHVVDGTWGASGSIWKLADLTRSAGYKHLQHLVAVE